MSHRHANRLIAASDAIENLGPRGPVLPTNDYHACHLAKLPSEQGAPAWDMFLETAKEGKAYKTFEAYAKGTWDMSKTNANRLITSSAIVDNLTPGGVILPSHEKHVRHLTKLQTAPQAEAWQQAIYTAPTSIFWRDSCIGIDAM